MVIMEQFYVYDTQSETLLFLRFQINVLACQYRNEEKAIEL